MNHDKTQKKPARLTTALLLFALGACTRAHADFTQLAAFKKSSVTGIEFELEPDNLGQFKFTVPVKELSQQISRNLVQWRFPVDNPGTHSHRLLALVGSIHKDSTPVGFSFGMGNSDPRAQDFQKTQVLPIACRLTTAHSVAIAEYKTTISSNGLDQQNKALDLLNDEISTACFNLLDQLQLQKPASATETQTPAPSWIPSVRIQVTNVPENKPVAKPTATTPSAPASSVGIPNNPPETASPAQATATGHSEAESDPTMIEPASENQRKQIIIHNQGTPLILEFGHQRR